MNQIKIRDNPPVEWHEYERAGAAITRLLVLLPNCDFREAVLANTLWTIVSRNGATVRLLAAVDDWSDEPRIRMRVALLAAMLRESGLDAEVEFVTGTDWVETVLARWMPGDVIVAAGTKFTDYTTVGPSALIDERKLISVGSDWVTLDGQSYDKVAIADFLDRLAAKVRRNNASLMAFNRIPRSSLTVADSELRAAVTTRACSGLALRSGVNRNSGRTKTRYHSAENGPTRRSPSRVA